MVTLYVSQDNIVKDLKMITSPANFKFLSTTVVRGG